MGDELKWLIKEGGEHIFESFDISLKNMPTSHTVTVLSLCSVCGINDFLQLIRSRYQPTSDASMEVQVPEFSLSLLQEDIVAYFLAGKPLIYIEPSSPLRIPFKFHQSTNSVEEAEWVVHVHVCVRMLHI